VLAAARASSSRVMGCASGAARGAAEPPPRWADAKSGRRPRASAHRRASAAEQAGEARLCRSVCMRMLGISFLFLNTRNSGRKESFNLLSELKVLATRNRIGP